MSYPARAEGLGKYDPLYFQLYFQFITLLHKGERRYLLYIFYLCIFLLPLLSDIYSVALSGSTKCIFGGTAKYLVNVFSCPFLDHTQCSYYYWHGVRSWCHIFSVSISRSLYLLILLCYLIDM